MDERMTIYTDDERTWLFMLQYKYTIPGAVRPIQPAGMNGINGSTAVSGGRDSGAGTGTAEPRLAKAGEARRDAAFWEELAARNVSLNADQIEAVLHGDGPLLTIAGAGSGKTTTLACRAAYLIAVRCVSPRHLLLVTFSRKAADEMKQRLAGLPGIAPQAAQSIEARTFHSFCLLLLRRRGINAALIGDEGQQRMTVKRLLREAGSAADYEPETLLALLSSYKCRLLTAEDLPEASPAEREIKKVLIRYEQWKRDNGLIDFDDLLLLAYRMLQSEPELLASMQDRFRYIMVDEFQDTNTVQYEIVRLIADKRRNLMVVGDDDQTIYSFNGASADSILSFDKLYPDAKVVTLRVNYRSSAHIVGLGNAIIRGNKNRRPKTLTVPPSAAPQPDNPAGEDHDLGLPGKPMYSRPATPEEEAASVTASIRKLVESGAYRWGDVAVLYRSASSGRAATEHLLQSSIPVEDHSDGLSFYDSPLIRPVMAHLKLALHHRDKQAIEDMLPTLYVNRESAMKWIRDKDAEQAKKWPLIHLTGFPRLQQFQKDEVLERLRLIKAAASLRPAAAIRRIRESFFDKFAETNRGGTPHKEMMKELLDELESSAGRFETVESFLTFAEDMAKRQAEAKQAGKPGGRPAGSGRSGQASSPDVHQAQAPGSDGHEGHEHAPQQQAKAVSSSGQDGGRVQLMTVHKSKGLEFPVVFVVGASEGIMPHRSASQPQQPKQTASREDLERDKDEALEEERRLLYVAVTRAKERLYVSSPAFFHGQKADISRFLAEAAGIRTAASGARSGSAAGR